MFSDLMMLRNSAGSCMWFEILMTVNTKVKVCWDVMVIRY